MMSKKTLVACAAACVSALPMVSHAELTANVGLSSDYRYRGISQSRLKPALQGGADYTQGGLYVGVWASTIKWIKDAGGDANLEIDVYGGLKGAINKDLSYDVGVLTYQYPSNKLKPITDANANTTEIYGALSFGPGTLKYSHAVSDTFGAPDSKNSFYLDLSASFDVQGFAVVPHVGYQRINGPWADSATYTDYALTVSKEVSGVVLSGAIVGTDADKAGYTSSVNGKFLGKTGVVIGAKLNF